MAPSPLKRMWSFLGVASSLPVAPQVQLFKTASLTLNRLRISQLSLLFPGLTRVSPAPRLTQDQT